MGIVSGEEESRYEEEKAGRGSIINMDSGRVRVGKAGGKLKTRTKKVRISVGRSEGFLSYKCTNAKIEGFGRLHITIKVSASDKMKLDKQDLMVKFLLLDQN